MDFIFMLTRDDATVANALEIVSAVKPLGLAHIGFKDVGVEPEIFRRLGTAIREAGARVWMEIVSTSRAEELRSIALGRDIGVDFLMGGVGAEDGIRLLAGSATRYLPFAGKPVGHRRNSAGRRRRWRRIAAPSRRSAAPGPTFSPIAPPRPIRSASSPPAGAASATGGWWSPPVRSIAPSGSPPSV